jgi:hypothetical protein
MFKSGQTFVGGLINELFVRSVNTKRGPWKRSVKCEMVSRSCNAIASNHGSAVHAAAPGTTTSSISRNIIHAVGGRGGRQRVAIGALTE